MCSLNFLLFFLLHAFIQQSDPSWGHKIDTCILSVGIRHGAHHGIRNTAEGLWRLKGSQIGKLCGEEGFSLEDA